MKSMEIVKKEASSSEVEPGRLLTVRDVAKWFKVHEKTVYEWAEREHDLSFGWGSGYASRRTTSFSGWHPGR